VVAQTGRRRRDGTTTEREGKAGDGQHGASGTGPATGEQGRHRFHLSTTLDNADERIADAPSGLADQDLSSVRADQTGARGRATARGLAVGPVLYET
jgi:hypothetical protein